MIVDTNYINNINRNWKTLLLYHEICDFLWRPTRMNESSWKNCRCSIKVESIFTLQRTINMKAQKQPNQARATDAINDLINCMICFQVFSIEEKRPCKSLQCGHCACLLCLTVKHRWNKMPISQITFVFLITLMFSK